MAGEAVTSAAATANDVMVMIRTLGSAKGSMVTLTDY